MQTKLIAQKVIVALIGSVLATSSFAGPKNRAAKARDGALLPRKSRSASAAAPRSARSRAAPSAS